MTRSRSAVALACLGVLVAMCACGESTTTTAARVTPSWFPSTALPSPGPAQATATPAVAASAPPGVGQASNSGLGTPAVSVAETDQRTFTPSAISVKVGQVIQWNNSSNAVHNVTFDDQPSLTSGSMSQGNTWQVQFSAPGTYMYHCTFHPGMTGQITVTG